MAKINLKQSLREIIIYTQRNMNLSEQGCIAHQIDVPHDLLGVLGRKDESSKLTGIEKYLEVTRGIMTMLEEGYDIKHTEQIFYILRKRNREFFRQTGDIRFRFWLPENRA